MAMRRTAIALLAATASIWLLCATARADALPILARPVPEFYALDRPAEQAAVYLARVGAFRLGCESAEPAVYPQPSPRRIRFQLRDTNVQAVLDAITQADPRYIWRLNGEFVNIMPKEAATDPTYYMNERVEQFEVKDVPLTDAVETLLELPGIRRHDPGFGLWNAGYKPTGEMNPQVTITANDVTWRTLMNRLALEYPEGMGWTARRRALPGVGGAVREDVDLSFGDSSKVGLPWEYPPPAMVPFRAAMEELGALVHWLPEERAAQARSGNISLRVWVGSTLVALTGATELTQEVNLGATTELRDGRIWVSEQLVLTARNVLRDRAMFGAPTAPGNPRNTSPPVPGPEKGGD